jgi:hypothetical protein
VSRKVEVHLESPCVNDFLACPAASSLKNLFADLCEFLAIFAVSIEQLNAKYAKKSQRSAKH